MAIATPTGAGNVTTAGAGSGTSISINKPSNTANGDVLVGFVHHRAATTPPTTPPAGWTRVDPSTDNTAAGVIRYYYKVISDAGSEPSSYTWAGAASGRHAGVIFRVTGADVAGTLVDVAGAVQTLTATTTNLPGVTTTTANGLLVAGVSTATTTGVLVTFTASGMTNLGNGATSTAAAESQAHVLSQVLGTAGATGNRGVTNSDFGATSTGAGYLLTLNAVPLPNTAPTCDAGANQTVTAGTPISLSGTDNDSDGTIVGRQWTCIEFPRGSTSPSITGATTANATFTPTATGAYVFQYAVTDNLAATASDTVTVYVPTAAVGVRKQVSATGFTNVGGATDSAAALSDGTATTYVQSAASGASSYRCQLNPLLPPNATFALKPTHLVSTTETPTSYTYKLYEDATLRKTWTPPAATTSASTPELTLSSGEIASISNWNALEVLIEWTI